MHFYDTSQIASLCLFTEFSIVFGCTGSSFVYFDWSVSLSIFCVYSEILSQPFLQHYLSIFFMFPVLEDWFKLQLQQSGCHFQLLFCTFYMFRLQVKFVLCLEINFLFHCHINLFYFLFSSSSSRNFYSLILLD